MPQVITIGTDQIISVNHQQTVDNYRFIEEVLCSEMTKIAAWIVVLTLHLIYVSHIQSYEDSYYVAVVEFNYGYNNEMELNGIQKVDKRVEEFISILGDVKKGNKPLDIIIFPESILVLDVDVSNYDEMNYVATYVPNAEDDVIPCSDDNQYSQYFKSLSCAAGAYKTYMVVNLKEKVRCHNDLKCASYKYNIYNTNVVFDRNGKVIARYRKFNLFGESKTNTTATADISTFSTDFGEKFGLFTCFDILFEYPSIQLIRTGVQNIIFPTMWFSEMPFLTGLQAQQMFSQGNNVAFLSSGASNVALGSGGSGIFLGKYGTLAQVILPSNESHYLYQKVPNDYHKNISGTQTGIEDRNAKLMDNFFIMVEDLTAYSSKLLHFATQQIEETVCQKENGHTLCCYFKLQTDMERQVELDDGRPKYKYRAVARLGKRSFSGVRNLYMENCGVVACLTETLSSCGKRFSNYSEIQWPITFTSLEVSANFTLSDRKQQFPNSLLPDITPISAEYTQWTSKLYEEGLIERTFRILKPVKKLLTFGILGRNYEKDD